MEWEYGEEVGEVLEVSGGEGVMKKKRKGFKREKVF